MYSVDWVAKEVTIPTSDLDLVGGNHYSMDMADFLAEIRRLEWEPTEGLWADAIVGHSNTRFNFAGANYAPFDEIINGYTIQFSGSVTRVDLIGSNNDLIDVLVVTGVSVVPSNSAGLQIVSIGSGLDAGQDAKLTSIFSELDSIEGGFGHAELMRGLTSIMSGLLSGAPSGPIIFKGINGTTTRFEFTVDADGNRLTIVTRNLAP